MVCNCLCKKLILNKNRLNFVIAYLKLNKNRINVVIAYLGMRFDYLEDSRLNFYFNGSKVRMSFANFARMTTASQVGHEGHKDKPKYRVGMNHFLLAR